jgi:SAM-dependent methyltransferase
VAPLYPRLPEAARSGFDVFLDLLPLEPHFELCLEAVLEDGSAAPIGSIRARHEPSPVKRTTAGSVSAPDSPPTLRDDLKELILRARTSGAAEAEAGLEPSGPSLPDEIDLEGKKVLDIGAGTGGVSREARARGAALVDGLDADAALVKLARLLTAYQRVTRVFFYHRDLASPGTYSEHYDVVLACSVLALVESALPQIVSITDGVFVTEPPTAGAPSAAASLDSLKASFQFARALSGPLVAYANSEGTLQSALRREPSLLESSQS